jgi:hypoxanthine phosphoribosyltransferase
MGPAEERASAMTASSPTDLQILIPAEQIQKRVREMARQISDDYRGRTIHVLALLENGFVFASDLVRSLEVPVVCQFIKPRYTRQTGSGHVEWLEIFFSHDADPRDKHVLLTEGLLHSGVTSEYLMADFRSRGAASVKLAALADRQSARRVPLQPDYFGFLVDDAFLVGYGLGTPEQTYRNLPYLACAQPALDSAAPRRPRL